MNRLFSKKKSKSPDSNGVSGAAPEISSYHPDQVSGVESPYSGGRERSVDGGDAGPTPSPRAGHPPTTAAPESRNGAASPSSQTGGNSKPKLVFHCQQAQGSPTGLISGFTSVKELYQKIAECYDMNSAEVNASIR